MARHRQLILNIILSSTGHMTAEEIYMKVKQIQPSIAVGTVYRNLGLMTAAGEISRIGMPNSSDRYEKKRSPHDHLVCEKCGAIADITISDLQNYLQKQTGVEILGYDLSLRYICKACKKGENA